MNRWRRELDPKAAPRPGTVKVGMTGTVKIGMTGEAGGRAAAAGGRLRAMPLRATPVNRQRRILRQRRLRAAIEEARA